MTMSARLAIRSTSGASWATGNGLSIVAFHYGSGAIQDRSAHHVSEFTSSCGLIETLWPTLHRAAFVTVPQPTAW